MLLSRANTVLIGAVARGLATSACVWAFLGLSLLPLFWAALLVPISFLSSSVLQLVALPVLAVAGGLDARRLAAQADDQHAAVMETLADVRQIMQEIHQMHAEMRTPGGGSCRS